MGENGSVFRVAYYEAGDRRLARAGATLSRRMENGGGIWRLELPARRRAARARAGRRPRCAARAHGRRPLRLPPRDRAGAGRPVTGCTRRRGAAGQAARRVAGRRARHEGRRAGGQRGRGSRRQGVVARPDLAPADRPRAAIRADAAPRSGRAAGPRPGGRPSHAGGRAARPRGPARGPPAARHRMVGAPARGAEVARRGPGAAARSRRPDRAAAGRDPQPRGAGP